MLRKFTPSVADLFPSIKREVNEIKPGERVQVHVPKEYSHPYVFSHDHLYIDWDAIEELQMDFRGSVLKPNVFVTLRFDKKNEASEVIVDIYHV